MRAYVLCPDRRGPGAGDAAVRCAEAAGLAQAIGLEVVDAVVVPITRPRPATLFGAGKVEDVKAIVADDDIGLVVVDGPLSPVQQRNLERAWDCKLLDRTGLILEIFGERARTREGRLQVELAHLNYQKSRLVRSWTHLERQRGGYGFLGGPGETQIEADRRQIQERIKALEQQLDKVKRTRALHRESRRRVPYPIVALVGYTNAGKSTLFNRLTAADVMAEDMLFATLDPTLRALRLPSGRTAILSDTVGFISSLPPDLVAAFRATLEEVVEADLIVHVRDISSPQSDAQARDVNEVLAALGIKTDADSGHILEAWNKIDLLDEETRLARRHQAERAGNAAAISAVTGEGVDGLLDAIGRWLERGDVAFTLELPAERGRDVNWLHENCGIEAREELDDGGLRIKGHVPPARMAAFRRRFPEAVTATAGQAGRADMTGGAGSKAAPD